MRILISNDDGVYAPGLAILADAMASIAEVRVVAPDRDRSAASNSLTLSRPLHIKQLDNRYYSVEGTPTDCVHLALTGLLDFKPDLVLSGINSGANLGDDVLYSGTVAAAMEGRYLGLPAMAISLVGENVSYYETAAAIAQLLVLQLRPQMLPFKTILNVNVPNLPLQAIKGIEVTRLGSRHPAEPTIKAQDPRGKTMYWIGPPGSQADADVGTDFYAVSQGHVSLTPLNLDMTHYKTFEQLSGWIAEINEMSTMNTDGSDDSKA